MARQVQQQQDEEGVDAGLHAQLGGDGVQTGIHGPEQGRQGAGRGRDDFAQGTVEQHAAAGVQQGQDEDDDAQGQDQVGLGQGKHGNTYQHPQGMEPIGRADLVESNPVAFGDVLSGLEVIERVVGGVPAHYTVGRGKHYVQMSGQNKNDQKNFKVREPFGHAMTSNCGMDAGYGIQLPISLQA